MTEVRVVITIGVRAETARIFKEWVWASRAQFIVDCFGFEPLCELARICTAELVLVDGSADPILGVAECSRVRVASRPLVLIAEDAGRVRSAASRAGVAAVLQSPVSRTDFERCVLEQCSLASYEQGKRPAVGAIQIGPRARLDRSARTLRVDGRMVTISAQKFDLLCYLIDRAGTAVRAADLVRDSLLRPSQAQRFKGLIQELRRHLGSARDVIQVVPGYGYRLDLSGGVAVAGADAHPCAKVSTLREDPLAR